MKKFMFSWLVVFVALGFVGESVASTLYVDSNSLNPVAPFSSWATAATSIQPAVNTAVNGDSVWVSNGTYAVTTEITVRKNITIQSVNGSDVTIVDGGGAVRCFNLGSSACTISGFNIINGFTTGYGGGIYCSDTTPVVENCVITGNSASSGGGISHGTANNCTISGNLADSGGGSRYGTLRNCTISGNSAKYGGGMVFGTANNCTISGNTAKYGGGMYQSTANNCTISGNSGGMRYGTALNSIIWHNQGGINSPDLYNTVSTNSCSPDVIHGIDGNITNAPLLVSSSHIATNSPCRGAGSSLYSSGVDIDGEPWLNPPSMGCDEYHGPGSVTGKLSVAFSGHPTALAEVPSMLSGVVQGAASMTTWDFGDGTFVTNTLFPDHVWDNPGVYDVVLTAFNDTYASGVSATQSVQVVLSGEKHTWVGNGHLYEVVAAPEGISWADAQSAAAHMGGYLATPVTDVENTFIYGLAQYRNYWRGRNGPLLGGFQPIGAVEPDGGWSWISGEIWDFENWDLGEPNDSDGDENRLQYWDFSPNWNDASADSLAYGYVVEYQIHESAAGSLSASIGEAGPVVTGHPLSLAGLLDGLATTVVWDFGDGTSVTNNQFPAHAWSEQGDYEVVFSAYNPDVPDGVSVSQTIHVVSFEEATLHVSVGGDDANDGLSWATAKATIQSGVDTQLYQGGWVLVSNGIYVLDAEITVGNDIVIQSLNGPEVTIVDGGGSNRCFNLGYYSCVVSGFTITNGYTTGDGGGIYCTGSNQLVTNCFIIGNAANRGGGMQHGTAMDCVIKGNSATLWGGGIRLASVYHSTITGNTAVDGGGATGSGLYDCLLVKNVASRSGGGFAGSHAHNCTVVDNLAGDDGGGACQTWNEVLDILNCIVVGNTAIINGNDIAVRSLSGSFFISNSCSSGVQHGMRGSITNAASFVDELTGDYRLQSNSPCINWGNNSYVKDSIDLDGNARILEGHVDIGCYEYQGILGLADSDGDGLLDDWEREFFGGNVLPEANPDGDGSLNGDEYVAGTDPTNAASFFHVTTDAAEVAGETRFIIEWTAATGRVYNVLWTPSLTEAFQPLETGIQYPQHSYTDTVHSAESSGYYRVMVMRADYDSDGDGLPNDWESQFVVADAYADGDHDGFNNISEYIAGTNPTNGTSFFTAANSVAEVDGTNRFVVEWISIPDRLYSVQWSTNLVAGFQILETGIEHPQNSYTDTTHTAESEGFFQVDVRMK